MDDLKKNLSSKRIDSDEDSENEDRDENLDRWQLDNKTNMDNINTKDNKDNNLFWSNQEIVESFRSMVPLNYPSKNFLFNLLILINMYNYL